MSTIASRAQEAARSIQKVETFFKTYNAAVQETPAIADFTFGNPHEMPLPAVVNALKTHAEPQTVDWFALPIQPIAATHSWNFSAGEK